MGLNMSGVPVLSSPDDEALLIRSRLADRRSAGVIVVGDLGEQVRGAAGAGQAPRPLFRIVLPADRLAGADTEHHALEIDNLRLMARDLRLLAPVLRERGDALGSADLAARTPELNANHLRSLSQSRKAIIYGWELLVRAMSRRRRFSC